MQDLPKIEGLTPSILWITLFGLVCIGTLIVLGDKVMDVFRKKRERDKLKMQPEDLLADSISAKVLAKLEPRFAEIDRKLANDKIRLDDHTLMLKRHNDQLAAVEEGNKVLCRGMLALLGAQINGSDEGSRGKLKESQEEITNYLIEK